MKVFPFVFLLIALPATAQIFPGEAKKGELKILTSVEVQKDEGCWSATKRTNFPLSVEECLALLAKSKRFPRVDSRNPMMQIVYPPNLFRGEQLHYVFGVHGNGWVFQPQR